MRRGGVRVSGNDDDLDDLDDDDDDLNDDDAAGDV